MPINILMPALSPTMEEGKLAKWHIKEGDKVKSGDVIAEIETDKATMEVEAGDDGIVGRLLVKDGTEGIKVNQIIAILLEAGEDKSALAKMPAAQPIQPIPLAPAAAPASPPPQTKADYAPSAKDGGRRLFASPLARRLAKEAGIDMAGLSGSAPHGRIVKADIDKARSSPAARPSAPPAGMSDQQILKLYAPDSYALVPHDSIRKIIAKRLVEAKLSIPHFYLTLDIEIDALIALRKEINADAPFDAEKNPLWRVSLNDMIIKALAMALRRVPDANVTWTEGGMLHHKHADVGVAVAIPGGLVTPIVRRADEKRLSDISNEMKDFASRAKERKLMPEEYQGGSAAVSNLGMYGIKQFAAVINPPHSSILAVGAGEERAVVRKGKIETATVMTVTLSTDHRAVDGALGSELLRAFKDLSEKPAGMLV